MYGKNKVEASSFIYRGVDSSVKGFKEIRLFAKEEFFLDILKKGALKIYTNELKQSWIMHSPRYIFELAINSGAKDCSSQENYYEIISEKEDFYKVKSELEKKLNKLEYSGIEWRPLSRISLDKEQSKKIYELLLALEELDDVQDVYINIDLKNI